MKSSKGKRWGGTILQALVVMLTLLAQIHHCPTTHSHASSEPCHPGLVHSENTGQISAMVTDNHDQCSLKSCSSHEVLDLKIAPINAWDMILPSPAGALFKDQNVEPFRQVFHWISGHFPNGPPNRLPARAPPISLA